MNTGIGGIASLYAGGRGNGHRVGVITELAGIEAAGYALLSRNTASVIEGVLEAAALELNITSGANRSLSTELTCLGKVSECGSKNNAAYGTDLILGTGSLCALSMSECRNTLLRYCNGVTGGAVIALGKTSVYTVGSLSLILHLGVACCGNDILPVAIRAYRAKNGGVTVLCTGRSGCNTHIIVAHSGNRVAYNDVLTVGADLLGITLVGAGRSDGLVGIVVSLSRNPGRLIRVCTEVAGIRGEATLGTGRNGNLLTE